MEVKGPSLTILLPLPPYNTLGCAATKRGLPIIKFLNQQNYNHNTQVNKLQLPVEWGA